MTSIENRNLCAAGAEALGNHVPTRDRSARRVGGMTDTFLSVYDGRECIGLIIARGKLGFDGFGCDERSLGTYPTQREAAKAIMEDKP